MRGKGFIIGLAAASSALALGGPAHAAPLTFDCDARTNASASVSNAAQAAPSISGTITAKQFRAGQLLPVVGASIIAPDGKGTVGFQLKAPAVDATEFDIILLSNIGGEREDFKVGTIAVNQQIAFRLFVTSEGIVTMFINDQSWSAPFMYLVSGTERAFCSTGQFEFSDLRFSG